MHVTYTAKLPEGATTVLIPGGIATPHGTSILRQIEGVRVTKEATTGQTAYLATAQGEVFSASFDVTPASGTYPDTVFVPHWSRFTQYADDLVTEIAAVGSKLTGLDRAVAIASHVAERFSYGHTDQPFNDGYDVVPALGCGLTTGSCVDINTYFIAALRAAGIEAGYITGFFFPQEKGGTCEDGHCWVVSRIDGVVHEWDIAPHLKLGTRAIQPGLNPKPGQRVACFHAMGLDFPDLGITGIKALIEPLAVVDEGLTHFQAPEIRLHAKALSPVA